MENEPLAIITSILPTILAFFSGIVSAYFALKGKQAETEPDADRAIGDLQVQLAAAAENMVKPLNLQIESLQRRVSSVENENVLLRAELEKEKKDKAKISQDLVETNKTVLVLQDRLDLSLKNEQRLRAKLNRIRKDIDTGELPSSTHHIPKEDD